MATRSVTTDDRLRDEIADEYRQRGYRVIVMPSSKQLPDFLKGYHPEIVAESSDESVAIKIQSRTAPSAEKDWGELATVIQQHPGWRLELIVGSHRGRTALPVIERPEIEARLQEGLRLSQANMLDAALLITWSAAEAAMRLACRRHQVDLPDFRPGTMISRLYTDGIIEREEYDLLLQYMHMRDAIAHGLRQGGLDSGVIEQLRRITLRLLGSAPSRA